MPASLSQFTGSFRRKSKPSQIPSPKTLSPTLDIPRSFEVSIYDNVTYKEPLDGGVTFIDKQPLTQGTGETVWTCKDRSDQVVEYKWTETGQQQDGSVMKSNLNKWSNDHHSVLWRQTVADGRYRLVNIWNTRNSKAPSEKIAGRVAVSEWFGLGKSTPTNHNTASAIVTATAGIAFMGLGSHPHPMSNRATGTLAPQGTLPSSIREGEIGPNQWEVLEDTESKSSVHHGRFQTPLPQTTVPNSGSDSSMRQGHEISLPYVVLGAAMC